MTLAAAVLAVALTLTSGTPTVSLHEFRKVQHGWTKPHVERVFDTHGRRAFLYADANGRRHLAKNYPAFGLHVVRVLYVAPAKHGPFRLQTKLLVLR